MKSNYRDRIGRFAVALLLTIASVVTLPATAVAQDLNGAIDLAGRQRMLSQRIAKFYFQLGVGARKDVAEVELKASSDEFSAAITSLKGVAPNNEVLTLLGEVESKWAQMQPLVSGTPQRESALAVFRLSSELLASSHDVVVALEKLSGENKSELINVSGRQRMLSQRMAALYMLRAWNFSDEALAKQYQTTETEFKAGIDRLAAAAETSAEIKAELRKLERHFKSFRRGAATGGNSVPSVMAHSAEKMLVQAQKIVSMYLALGAAA